MEPLTHIECPQEQELHVDRLIQITTFLKFEYISQDFVFGNSYVLKNKYWLYCQVEREKYKRGIVWIHELLYQAQFSTERLKIVANKMINDVSQYKRNGRFVVQTIIREMLFIKGRLYKPSSRKCSLLKVCCTNHHQGNALY